MLKSGNSAALPLTCSLMYSVIAHVQIMVMHNICYTVARGNLPKSMEQMYQDGAPVVITRKAEGAVVMIDLLNIFKYFVEGITRTHCLGR